MAGLWPHLMRDVPALEGRTGYVHTRERPRKLGKRCHTPVSFSLFPFCFFSLVFLSLSTLLLPQVFPFLQLNTNNSDLSLRIIQTLCLHLSRSTPLRKTLTINHYLRIEYFQQGSQRQSRVRFIEADSQIAALAIKLKWKSFG